jgi:serine/threonine protein kinase/tetratricopeptide (TPR) repeat protein
MIPDRLAEALIAYSNALDAGEPVDHSGFLEGFDEAREALRPLLSRVDALHRLRAAVRRDASAATLVADTRLGDFEIVGMLGRGGMGVVYEAIQHPIGRRVALKVVPAAPERDRPARDRFLHEARIAALLHHEHIVPVYAVGEAEDAQFYAMQLIRGRSLADVLGDLRRGGPLLADHPTLAAEDPDDPAPAPAVRFTLGPPPDDATPLDPIVDALGPAGSPAYQREVVRLIAQAADALAYAHEMGVVHRDVKPGNLLLDRRGKLWLTDFGLAHARDGGGAITVGRPVGTPRYVAPEQADPRRGPLDGRADQFSLGATLYELLCLHPTHDAEGDAALLRQVLQDEPVPIRRRNPAVPPDLATVVHKAMAKEPADRYATATALAEDLRRFLDGRPVVARPLSRLRRANRWTRRHRRGLAAAAAALACGLILGLAGSTTVFFRQKVRAEDRERQLLEVVRSLNGAELLFRNQPGAGAGHRVLVQQLRDVLTRLADEPGAAAALRWEAANACLRLSNHEERAGNVAASRAALGEAVRRLRALARDEPGHPDYRLALARALRFEISLVHDRDGTWGAAAGLAREALALYEELAREDPVRAEYRNDVSFLCDVIARDHAARDEFDAAIAAMRRGLAADESLARQFPEGHPLSYIRLAGTWHALSQFLILAGRVAEAEAALRQALANDAILADRFPVPPNNRRQTFGFAASLGQFLLARGRLDEAVPLLDATLRDARNLRALYPDEAAWRDTELVVLLGRAEAAYLAGRDDEARAAYGEFVATTRGTPPTWSYRCFIPCVPYPELTAGLEFPTAPDDHPNTRYLSALSRLRRPDGAAEASAAFAALIPQPGQYRALEGAARFRHAQALARLGRAAEARRAFDAAERLDLARFACDGTLPLARREAALALGLEP